MFRKILKWVGIVLALVLAFLAIQAWRNWDLVQRLFLGGLHTHETVPPALPADLPHPAVLVFSKTNAFRHEEAIPAGNAFFAQWAKAHGWGYFQTENGATFRPDILSRFDVVVFDNVSGDVFSADQQAALKDWIERGGGFIGIHAAGDNSHEGWKWYADTLIGAHFTAHTMKPQFQTATVRVENPGHAVNAGLPASWQRTEEWYSFSQSPRGKGYGVLLTVDENSYRPIGMFGRDLRMGSDHPVVWWHCEGRGRTLYSALGHKPEAFAEPEYTRLLGNALEWAARRTGSECDAPKQKENK